LSQTYFVHSYKKAGEKICFSGINQSPIFLKPIIPSFHYSIIPIGAKPLSSKVYLGDEIMEIRKEQSTSGPSPPLHDAWPCGWRAKIGAILPSVDLITPLENQIVLPRGVASLHTRVMLKETTPEALKKSSEEVLYAAELLATVNPDVITYHCTSGTIIKGAEYERDLIQKIEEVSGAKATSMAFAITKAFEFLNVKKIIVVSPYLDEIVDAEERYFESFGFETVLSETMRIPDPLAVMARPPWENYHFALNAYHKAPEVDLILISCGALRSIEIIEHLELQTGKPVVSSNLCDVWHCLKLAGIKEPIYGCGSLLAKER
jgi:maleate isomerase